MYEHEEDNPNGNGKENINGFTNIAEICDGTDKDMEDSVTAIDPVELKQIETDSPDMQLATPNTIPPSKEEIRAQRKAEREEARAQRKADRAQRKADRKQAREDRKKGKTEEPQPKTTIDNLGAGHINLITLNDSQETNGVSV